MLKEGLLFSSSPPVSPPLPEPPVFSFPGPSSSSPHETVYETENVEQTENPKVLFFHEFKNNNDNNKDNEITTEVVAMANQVISEREKVPQNIPTYEVKEVEEKIAAKSIGTNKKNNL